jgi:hypothetical protein
MKIVRTYQQTFVSGTAAAEVIFRFNKVYKQDPKHKFQISCTCLASTDGAVSPIPHLFFASGLQAVNSSNSNVSFIASIDGSGVATYTTSNNPTLNNNDFFLGTLGGGVNSGGTVRGDIWIVDSPKIIVDNLPLDNITIYYRHPSTANTDRAVNALIDGLFFAFEINEIRND